MKSLTKSLMKSLMKSLTKSLLKKDAITIASFNICLSRGYINLHLTIPAKFWKSVIIPPPSGSVCS